jgi:dTDP-glucose pyrophosphorylase
MRRRLDLTPACAAAYALAVPRLSKAVILAAGRGTRMQQERPGVRIDDAQRRMAEQGLKGLIPFHGHPFLAYSISALADAGYRDVCLVVRPAPDPIREYFAAVEARRVRISFAVQSEPLGSAHALLSAEDFAAGEPFLVINSDNDYPATVLAAMRDLDGPGLAGFDPDALVSQGNIPPERLAAYALVTMDDDGFMTGIVEKPDPETRRRLEGRSRVSMTCWRFGPAIFEACRRIEPSRRGEYELPDAVAYAMNVLGERFRVVPVAEPVLDLSNRGDIPSVAAFLEGRSVCL